MTRFRSVALATIAALGIVLGALCPAQADDTPATSFGILNASAASAAVCGAQSCVTLPRVPLPNQSLCWVQVTGTFVGTILLEGSLNGSAFVTQSLIVPYGASTTQASITAVGLYEASCGPTTEARMSAYTSGSAQVTLSAVNYAFGGASASVVSGTAAQNILQVATNSLSSTQGLPVQYYGKPNAVNQVCSGVSTVGGAAIVPATQNTPLTPSTTTLILGLTAATVIHVCAFDITAVLTGGANISFEYGTQTTNPCDTGTTVIATYIFGILAAQQSIGHATQPFDLFAIPSAQQFCIVTGAYIGTAQAFTLTAKY